MSGGLPPGFSLDQPPSGFRLDPPAPRPGKVKLEPYTGGDNVRDLGPTYKATGDVVDGDTIKVDPNLSARLFGFDAFERGQPGYRPNGQRLDLGAMSTSSLTPYIRPSQPAYGTGGMTYGRPVVTLGNGATDPVIPMLWQGAGYAAPEYLKADPARSARYSEAERLGRLNRQGGFGANHIRPDAYRRPLNTRTAKLAADEFLAYDDELPDDAPKLKRLDAAQEGKIAAYLASQAGNPNFSLQQYRDWFRNDLGVTDIEPSDNPKFIEDVRKGQGFSPSVDYGTLDAESQRELQELVAFSGLRPEDAQGYRDLLKSGDQAKVRDYARSKGMTLDPRDVSAYFGARGKGGNAPIPLPIINPGDGRSGATFRGFGDPLGFLDEMGGVVDTIGGTANRENIWNSSRSFGDIYENNTRQNRAIIDYDETHHPGYRFGGQLVSSLALPGSIGARGVAGYAKAGGAIGGVYGFGSADGDLGDRLLNVPLNAGGGALLGATFGKGFDLAVPRIAKGLETLRGLRRDAGSAPLPPRANDPASVATDAADGLPPGFSVDAPTPPRVRDRLDIARGNADALPIPALGERVPSAYSGPVTGKAPTLDEIMPQIQDWAKSQSKRTMFHGSPRSGITEFDPYGRADYGLFGQGTYLTDNPAIAAGYTGKGMKAAGGSEGRTIYGVNQSVSNPLDMDAPADLEAWARAAGDYTDQFSPGMTNAEAFRTVEDALGQEGLPKWEGAEMMNDVVRNMGHDGITHIGGGRFGRGDGPRHKVVIALEPEQTQITGSLSVGDMLRAPQRDRSWIDIASQPAPTGGTLLERVQAMGQRLGQQRANMAGDALPSLSSPRIRDTIDVNASRTTRLMDGPTDAMMRTGAARVEPGDVLPRPANEIQSLDEFNRISDGLYPDVRGPNERDILTSRQFPSRANPDNMLNRRGPLDLAAFVRSEGGVADFGGELKAAGLSNAARNGDDFAGGENRLGPLLNDEGGASLDDMAQRAWETGYFPDHAERPPIDEFVTALGDTYRGVNRTFRPDDFAEIDAFNAARDQRLAVERARQEGAPLADDRGQPATYDDIIANTPPATAYDDWNNAVVSKVGNIRVDKLESPQDIGQALKVAENVAGGFDAARRGTISHAETQALAQDLGMTADDLLARRKGQAFSAEEAYAARAILAKSGTELVNMARRIRRMGENPGDEALSSFRKALVRHAAIQEQVSGMTAEAGRALSAFRIAADSRDIPGRVLEGLANAGGGTGRLKDAAERIIDLAEDPANLNRFIEKVSKPKFSDRAQEIWYNYLLSGPQTHMVNMLSNTMTALGQIPEHAVAAGVGAARRAFRRDEADRVLFSELGARSVGLMQGTKEGIREFARAFRTGEASDFVTKMESQTQKAVPGIKGEILRIPTRLLTAEDELFKAAARRMELSGLAVRQAGKEGLKGRAAKERAAELLADPTDDMMMQVMDYGRYLTFQRPLGDGLAGGLSRITQNQPFLKAVLPFIRTPTNLIKFTAERSPLAPMVKEWRKDFAAGGARRDLAVAKVMVGSGMGAVIADLAAKGVITGSAPSDDNQRRLLMANGWQPYSIKIGDQYYSYRRLDPFAMTFGTAADLATLGNGMTDKQREKGAALWAASVVANLASRTWLSGVTDALEALQDPERYSGNFIKRLIGAATVPTGSAQLARTIDPTMRETPDTASYMSSRMPGRSDSLLPKRDVWGQPIVSEGGVGPDILSPIWTSTDRKDPITQEALRVGATISPPKKGDMTPEQYDRLQPIVGDLGRKWIGELITSLEYQALDRDSQADEIGDVMEAARKEAKAHVLGGEPLDDERPVKKQRGSKRAAGLPEGFEVDSLPSGFVLDR